jgi:hypothetical protein
MSRRPGWPAIPRPVEEERDVPNIQPDPLTSLSDGEGSLRVMQETDDIVAISLEGEFDMANSPLLVE